MKNKGVLLVFCIGVSLTCTLGVSQPIRIKQDDRASGAKDLRFEHISLREGLSHSIVTSIVKDTRGLMWFGTPGGLNLYDGYSFKVFKVNHYSDEGLANDHIRALAVDSSGVIWIGTDVGVITYDYVRERFHRIPISDEPGLDNLVVTAIFIDSDGNAWAGISDRGLFLYDKSKDSLSKVANQEGLSFNNVNDIIEDEHGNLWIGGDSFASYDRKTKKFTPYAFHISGIEEPRYTLISDLLYDKDGTIWLSTIRNGLYRFIPSGRRFSQFDILKTTASLRTKGITDYEMDALGTDGSGDLWIGTNQGLNIFNPISGTSIQYTNHPDNLETLNSNEILSMYLDKSRDLIWLGTLKGGINKCDLLRKELSHFKFDTDNPNASDVNNISSIYEDPEGYLWIGTWSGGLIRYHRKTQSYLKIDAFHKTTDYLPHANVASINEDKLGNLWLASWRGHVTKIDAATKHASRLGITSYNRDQHRHLGFEGWNFRHLYKDKNNDLWIVSFDEGLFKIVNTGIPDEPVRFVQVKPVSENGTPYRCWSMHQDNTGTYWVATEDGLLTFRIDGEKIVSLKCFVHDRNDPRSVNHNSVRVVYEDSRMNLWVGTGGGGLDRVDRRTMTFSHLTVKEGLPNNMIYGILEDNHGDLWLSTENGISRYDPDANSFTNYEVSDGLQSNEFNIGAYFKNLATGEMFFGGINGITSFFPDRIESNPHPPDVIIADFKLFNRSVIPGEPFGDKVILEKAIWATDEIELSYRDNAFAFDLVALHYSTPEKNSLAYMLQGFDADWIYTNREKGTAVYTNLNPGTYHFKAKAANNDGLWNNNIKTITIRILPPFWQTIWFRLLAIAFLSAIVITIFRMRMAAIKAQKRALESLVQKRTLEIALQKEEIEAQKNQLSEQAEALIEANAALTLKQEELKQQNGKIIEQMDQVRMMATRLHEADEKKLQFFTNISHEIRTPLTLISGPLERIMKTDDNRENKQLKLIQTNVRRLFQLVDQVMDIRKLETGTLGLQLRKGDIVDFIRRIRDKFGFLAEQKKIRLTLQTTENHLWAYFDTDKLEKIISNLLSNAFKFTSPHGQISMDVSILNHGIGRSVQISISDTGIGIPKEKLPRIFDRFYQVPHAEIQEKGMGVGLALVKDIVRLHEGRITVDSTLGKGSVFTITLPLIEQDEGVEIRFDEPMACEADAVDQITGDKERASPQNHDNDRLDASIILIVEDNEDIRTLIRECFSDSNEVYEAANGFAGFEIAKEIVPDVIISDIMMPVMDGISLCKAIKAEEITCHIPIILLTARTHDSFMIKGLETGAEDYIVKPFKEEVLKLKVQNLIRARRLLRQKFSKQLIIKPFDISVDSENEVFIKKAIKAIEDNMAKPLFGVEDFCEIMAVSYIQLYRKFQGLIGQSPTEFIKTIRLQRAAQLLSKNRYTVAEVSDQVGFNDPSYFIRCFKKHFGKTPKDFACSQDGGVSEKRSSASAMARQNRSRT